MCGPRLTVFLTISLLSLTGCASSARRAAYAPTGASELLPPAPPDQRGMDPFVAQPTREPGSRVARFFPGLARRWNEAFRSSGAAPAGPNPAPLDEPLVTAVRAASENPQPRPAPETLAQSAPRRASARTRPQEAAPLLPVALTVRAFPDDPQLDDRTQARRKPSPSRPTPTDSPSDPALSAGNESPKPPSVPQDREARLAAAALPESAAPAPSASTTPDPTLLAATIPTDPVLPEPTNSAVEPVARVPAAPAEPVVPAVDPLIQPTPTPQPEAPAAQPVPVPVVENVPAAPAPEPAEPAPAQPAPTPAQPAPTPAPAEVQEPVTEPTTAPPDQPAPASEPTTAPSDQPTASATEAARAESPLEFEKLVMPTASPEAPAEALDPAFVIQPLEPSAVDAVLPAPAADVEKLADQAPASETAPVVPTEPPPVDPGAVAPPNSAGRPHDELGRPRDGLPADLPPVQFPATYGPPQPTRPHTHHRPRKVRTSLATRIQQRLQRMRRWNDEAVPPPPRDSQETAMRPGPADQLPLR